MAAANSSSSSTAAAAAVAAAGPVTVFVAGGTSNTGSAAINSLLAHHPNVTIRAGVRDLKKANEKFPTAAGAGADAKRLTFVVHDVKNAHLTAAQTDAADAAELKGVDALLLVPPQSFQDRRGVPTAYIRAAKAAGVKHIVTITTTASAKKDLYLSADMVAIEQEIAASGVPYSVLRPGSFYENHWGNKTTIAPVDGSAAFYAPIAGDALFAAISVADIGEAAANALARNGGAAARNGSRVYHIGGIALTHDALAGVYSRVLNKPVKFVSIPDAAFAQTLVQHAGYPEATAKGLAQLYRYYEAESVAVKAKGAAAVAQYYSTADLSLLLNGDRAPTTFAQWLVQSGAAAAFGGVKQTVFVAGAAGNTGSATVKSLLRDHPHVVMRAGVRDAKKAEGVFGAELKGDGKDGRLTFAVHDVKDGHLTAAQTDAADAAELKGVDTLVFVPPQGTADRVGIVRAYLKAAKAAGVKHVVAITTPGVVKPQLILTSGLAATEAEVVASGLPHTFVRPVFFFENHFGSADTIKGHGAFYGPIAGDAKLPGIAVSDIGEATANAATWGGAAGADRKGYHGKAYAVAGEVQSSDAQAAVFTRVTGKPVKFVSVTDDGCVQALTGKGFPATVAKGFVELYRGFESGAFGAAAADTSALQSLLNDKRLPTRLEQWLKPVAAAFK